MRDVASKPGPLRTLPRRGIAVWGRLSMKWTHLESSQSSRKSRSTSVVGRGKHDQNVRLANRLGRRGVCAAIYM
jgi:hypothetical protein